MVPARHLGGEVALAEGGGRLDGPPGGVVVVDVREPAGEGLGVDQRIVIGQLYQYLQMAHTGFPSRWRPPR